MEKKISFFNQYLSLWVLLCIGIGIFIGKYLPAIPNALNKFEFAHVSIPIAILLWLMIFPMMLKIDFQSIKYVKKHPQGLLVTCVTNWLIKPFTMFFIAWFFFFVVFKHFITPTIANEYLSGAVLLGAAPCTAMVFVWSYLTNGNAGYTLVQVAVNDLIILIAYAPIVAFLLGVSGVTVPWMTLVISIVFFVVIPLSVGVVTRRVVVHKKGGEYFNKVFLNKFQYVTEIGLLLTLIMLFSFQGKAILNNPTHILLIAIPLIIQTFIIFFIGIIYFRLVNSKKCCIFAV